MLNSITFVAIGVFTALILCGYWLDKFMSYFILYTFVGLGFGFLIVGIWMVHTIKNNFTEFYQKAGCKLICATLLLSIPMYLRGINWFFQINSQTYYDFYYKWIAYTNAVYAILTTVVPVVAQMSSLIFGALKD